MAFDDQNAALDHFATHIWVRIQEANIKKMEEHNKMEDLFNFLFTTLPLDKWLEEQNLAQDHPDAIKFLTEMKKRVHDVIRLDTGCNKKNGPLSLTNSAPFRAFFQHFLNV